MDTTPHEIVANEPDLLPLVRALLQQYPDYRYRNAYTIAAGLRDLRYMDHRPPEAAVEAVLEALSVEGEVLA